MRGVSRACIRRTERPAHFSSIDALAERLCADTGIAWTACFLSLLALKDMRLITVDAAPCRLKLLPMKKTDPESSAVWRRIQSIRKVSEGRQENG